MVLQEKMSPPDPIPLLAGTPVVPVLTIERVEHAVPLARALLAGGLKVIEVTLRTRAALETIAAIAAQVPECVVGAGTVLSEADVASALAAGAKYLVSPGTTAELAAALAAAPVPALPGCASVSEALTLSALGFRVAEIGRGTLSGAQILPDRRHRLAQCRGLPRAAERHCGRRLLARAAGRDRGREVCAHHRARARGGGIASLRKRAGA